MGIGQKIEFEKLDTKFFIIENAQLVTHDLDVVSNLCTQPYYNHKKGCPNFGVRDDCPPNIKHISEEYEMDTIHILVLKFPLGDFHLQRKEIHPNWTDRALINPRHWQNHLRACMNDEWEAVKEEYPDYEMIKNPEGQGVNISDTLQLSGIDLTWSVDDGEGRIINVAEQLYRVALIGKRICTQDV